MNLTYWLRIKNLFSDFFNLMDAVSLFRGKFRLTKQVGFKNFVFTEFEWAIQTSGGTCDQSNRTYGWQSAVE